MAFFSAKGGSGATTVATNTAIQVHRMTGKRTVLVDLDLELGEIALFLGVEPRFSFVDLSRNFHRMDSNLLASFIECHESGIHVLSAPYQPERADVVTADQTKQILQFLKQHYQYVVVDLSNSFTVRTVATFEKADEIYLVANVDLAAIIGGAVRHQQDLCAAFGQRIGRCKLHRVRQIEVIEQRLDRVRISAGEIAQQRYGQKRVLGRADAKPAHQFAHRRRTPHLSER